MPAPPPDDPAAPLLSRGSVARTWWPLAASWLLMGLEVPALTAVVARMVDPQINLAAFGALVFPLALIIESPIIMMLAASTALSRDTASYRRLYRFMWRLSALLTLAHVIVAFTPLFDVIALGLIGAPEETVEPARLGLRLLTPWTWAIADRRFHQGVLIRFGRSVSAVGTGTLVRLAGSFTALAVGYGVGTVPGIAVATGAMSFGVLMEAIFVRFAVAPVLRGPLREATAPGPVMTLRSLLIFYVPLAMTPLLGLMAQPIGSAAMSRMPDPLLSLAAWPALGGLIFLTRSVCMAFNEVVVSLGDRPGAVATLRRFALVLGAVTTLILLLLAATPLGGLLFAGACGLDAELTALAVTALWLGVPMPMLTVLQSFYQGYLVHAQRTRGIPESVGLFLAVSGVILAVGITGAWFPGVHVTLLAFSCGAIAQTAWLAFRCRGILAGAAAPERAGGLVPAAAVVPELVE